MGNVLSSVSIVQITLQVFLKPWHLRQLESELELIELSARKLQQGEACCHRERSLKSSRSTTMPLSFFNVACTSAELCLVVLPANFFNFIGTSDLSVMNVTEPLLTLAISKWISGLVGS